jgi:hypothetical protein
VNYIDVPTAGWSPGGLSTAANPYYIRFRTGALTGRVMLVPSTANTASRVFLSTDGTDLTQAGLVTGAAGDGFELVMADTVGSLFGSGTPAGRGDGRRGRHGASMGRWLVDRLLL